ncbi:MAG TPA: hypothetical protein PLU22_26385, partial [Polyangiaceae bacterium]|nr:hypothetical protein [Polyangiaceae bacterium]
MVSYRWQKSIVPAFALIAAPMLMNCSGGGGVPGMPGGGGACKVDLKDPSAIMKASFGIDAELEGKVKAAMAAGANLQKIAADIEAEIFATLAKAE